LKFVAYRFEEKMILMNCVTLLSKPRITLIAVVVTICCRIITFLVSKKSYSVNSVLRLKMEGKPQN
jgi:hypothetical protein